MYVIQNGKLIQKEEASIPLYSKANFFDFAVYDSIKVVQGKPFFPEFHVDRLLESARIIDLEHPFTKKEIAIWIQLLIDKNKLKDSLIRFLLIGAGDEQEEPTLFMFPVGLTFYDRKWYKKGVKVITYHGERIVPDSKAKDLLLNFIALREAKKNDAIEALLIDTDGNIREGTRSNFFAVKGSVLYTPPLTDVLEGVTRKIVVDSAKKETIEVKEEKIPYEKLDEFDEFFVTSTSMNIMPIVEIDDRIVASEVGPITKSLIKSFKEFCKSEGG
ncbi:aminotransferase class IV [Patescibacteria group bacterium]|nr:aminotransferase class IV [Patescibacteria group bacterium]